MAASANDLLVKTGEGTATTLSSPGYTIGATSVTVVSTTNWPTDTGVIFAIDTAEIVNGEQVQVAGTYCEFEGVVTGATTIASVDLITGTPQNYSAGALTRVYIPLSSEVQNRMVDALLVSHDQDGTMIDSLPLTTPKVTTSINDASGNEVIKTPATASAVNEITVTNSATGVAPSISATGGDSAIDLNLRGKGLAKTVTIGVGATKIFPYDYVVSGCVWSGDAYASTRNASMTAGVVVINGNPVTVALVTARSFTASRDTYIDVLDNGNGTGLLVYTEVTNNAASPALASNSIRIGIIVTGASNIANVGSVNQGEETKVLPIASSVPYAVTDSLGNLICPRDPNRKVLGYRQIVSNFSTAATSATQITGLSCPVIIPTGRKIRVTYHCWNQATSNAGSGVTVELWDGVVLSGAKIQQTSSTSPSANQGWGATLTAMFTATGSKTYNLGVSTNAGTLTLNAGATTPAFVLVELV